MKVLSLFDGMSGGQQALNRLGVKVDKYYASEVDKFAIKVTQDNFPNTIQVGSVTELKGEKFKNIDLLIAGSPCQGFSVAGKMKGMSTKEGLEITTLKQYKKLKKKGFEFDGQSYLFWEFVRILNKVKPKYFILENVRVQKKWKDTFNEALWGIEPVMINSALVSAQNRVRYYWVGERQEDGSYKRVEVGQPEDKGIMLKDILVDDAESEFYLSEKATRYITDAVRLKKKLTTINGDTASCLMAQYSQSLNGTFLCVDCNGRVDDRKTGTLTQRYGKGTETYGSNPFIYGGGGMIHEHHAYRKLTPLECERLQTVDDNYTGCVSNSQRYKMLGNGFTIEVIVHILKEIGLCQK